MKKLKKYRLCAFLTSCLHVYMFTCSHVNMFPHERERRNEETSSSPVRGVKRAREEGDEKIEKV